MKATLLALLSLYALSSAAQDLKAVEQELLQYFKKISYWSAHQDTDPGDSLLDANERFKQRLLIYTSCRPATLAYDFPELRKENLTIAQSTDGKFRIYSWDTRLGGTMHTFENVYQFKTNSFPALSCGRTREEGDPGGWFSEIFTLDTNDRQVYIGYFHAIYSSKDAYQGIKLFELQNNTFNDALRLIKTQTGLKNELGFGFDFFSVADRTERPVKLIYYDDQTRTIKIPVINKQDKVTKKFITYKFTGMYFERQKNRQN